MKVITADAELAAFTKIFKEMQGRKQKVVFWQVYQDKRTIADTVLYSLNPENRSLSFLPPEENFHLSLPVFFYVEDQQLIFKSSITDSGASLITMRYPEEIKLLEEESEGPVFARHRVKTYWSSVSEAGTVHYDDDFVKVKSMKERTSRDQDFLEQEFEFASLDEEEKMFADKRESPRVRPKVDKLVKVVRKGETEFHVMKLFDLSRGGLGFLTYKPDEFPKNSEVYITGFDAFDLDDPLIGTVVAHRPLDEANLEFKIGVKFNDGQE